MANRAAMSVDPARGIAIGTGIAGRAGMEIVPVVVRAEIVRVGIVPLRLPGMELESPRHRYKLLPLNRGLRVRVVRSCRR
jgi:hypothetical protein